MSSGDDGASTIFDDLQIVALTATRVGEARGNVVSAGRKSLLERVPFRVSSYHAGLTCRFVEATEAAITVFKADQFAAAITLTQSAIRTTAALWQLYSKVETAVAARDCRSLDKYLAQVYRPRLNERTARASEAATVTRFLEHADDRFQDFQRRCEQLLYFDTPEWFGAGQLYVRRQPDSCSLEFRRHLSRDGETMELMSGVLKITALAYEHFNRELLIATRRLHEIDARANNDKMAAADVAGQSSRNYERTERIH